MSGDAEALSRLRNDLRPHLTTEEAPLGFVLNAPTERQRLYVLTDRSGYVLGRTRHRDQALAMLGGHLAALLTPKPDTIRLRARALLGPDGTATLLSWPILQAPPAVERRLEVTGHRTIDRLCVDVDPRTCSLDLQSPPWPELQTLDPGPGHLAVAQSRIAIQRLLTPAHADSSQPTFAQVVHYLTSIMVGAADREQALDAAESMAATMQAIQVPYDDVGAVYALLATDSPSDQGQKRSGSASEKIEDSYDELSYGWQAFRITHPVEIATTAELQGLATTPIERCSVLELGCGEGGNLVPLAEAYPQATFTGLDLSNRQIDRGMQRVRDLGLSNVQLKHHDILQVDADLGRFDYIICHGVFSWVPPAVQAKILDICHENVTPNGVSYISYNTYPRWHIRGMLRDAMLQAVDPGARLVDQVAAAREFLGRMIDDLDARTAYGHLVTSEAEGILDSGDSYIAHEYLAEVNEPLHHHEFVDRASANGLRYLGDHAAPSNAALMGNVLISANANDPRRQSYQDTVRYTGFRAAILCRDDAPLEPERGPAGLSDFHVSTRLRDSASKRDELAALDLPADAATEDDESTVEESTVDVTDESDTAFATDSPAVQAALRRLIEVEPASMWVTDLAELVAADLQEAQSGRVLDELCNELQRLYAPVGKGPLALLRQPYDFTTTVSSRPSVSGSARLAAQADSSAINRRHEGFALSDSLTRFLVQHLDGTRTIEELVIEATEHLARSGATLELDKATFDEASATGIDPLRLALDQRLERLARGAMLTS